MVVCHFIVSDDVERSRRFYTEVLGGKVVFGPEPTYVALANNFIIINGGGGPTDDKPSVTLRRQATPTGSAASSISGSRTSTRFTSNGVPEARSS
jgi:catechol 2,3-dioxygenase-like lactoylglutathione lyase family enzyme